MELGLGEGIYEVVWPRGRRVGEDIAYAERIKTLEGKTICELSNRILRPNEVFPLIERELVRRCRGINFVR